MQGAGWPGRSSGDSLFGRRRALLGADREAGGKRATLLLHDGKHGSEMIGMMARFGRGLPAQVLPFPLNEVTQVGIDFLAAAFAYGAGQVVFLADPKKRDELGGLAGQIGLAETVLNGLGYGGGRLHLIDALDRSEESRVGKECGRNGNSRWSQYT